MIVLDTNVLSEVMKSDPEVCVIEWMDAISGDQFMLTSITVAEILYGIQAMPEGKRKTHFISITGKIFDDIFAERILSFDQRAAVEYADIVVNREKIGMPISMADAQIASICRSRELTLATRNIKDFTETGVELFNPWTMPV